MIQIYFRDIYGGSSSVFIHGLFNIDALVQVYGLIEDFLEITGDAMSDESAYQAGRKFTKFIRGAGYPVSRGSPVESFDQFKIDLASGNISSDRVDSEARYLPLELGEDRRTELGEDRRALSELGEDRRMLSERGYHFEDDYIDDESQELLALEEAGQ